MLGESNDWPMSGQGGISKVKEVVVVGQLMLDVRLRS